MASIGSFRTARSLFAVCSGVFCAWTGVALAQQQDSPPAAEGIAPPVPVVAVALDEAVRPADDVFYFYLDDGRGFALDRLRREPSAARQSRLAANLFERIGRRRDRPARPGELLLLPLHRRGGEVEDVLLVETSTGYVAYFEKIGKGGPLDTMHTTIGRPFEGLAADDGRFVLLGRKGGGGRTEDAWLYHTPSGRAQRLRGVAELPSGAATSTVAGLPQLAGEVAAAGVDAANGRTNAFVLVDAASGSIDHVAVDEAGSVIGVRRHAGDLWTVFPSTPPSPAAPRFLLVPVDDDRGATRHVLIIDTASGILGWLRNVDQGTAASLSRLGLEIERFLQLTGAPASRSLTAVARYFGDGDTLGAWLIDARGRRLLYLDGFGDPGSLRATPVEMVR